MPRQMGGAKPYSSDAWDAGRAVEEMCSRRTRRARRRVVGAMRVGWRVIVLSTIAGAAGTIKSMGDGFDDESVKGSASKPRGGGLVPGGAVVPPRMCRHERVYPRGCGVTPGTVCQEPGATGPSLRVSRRKRASLSRGGLRCINLRTRPSNCNPSSWAVCLPEYSGLS